MNKMCSLNYCTDELKSCYPLLPKCIEISNISYQSIKEIKQFDTLSYNILAAGTSYF